MASDAVRWLYCSYPPTTRIFTTRCTERSYVERSYARRFMVENSFSKTTLQCQSAEMRCKTHALCVRPNCRDWMCLSFTFRKSGWLIVYDTSNRPPEPRLNMWLQHYQGLRQVTSKTTPCFQTVATYFKARCMLSWSLKESTHLDLPD